MPLGNDGRILTSAVTLRVFGEAADDSIDGLFENRLGFEIVEETVALQGVTAIAAITAVTVLAVVAGGSGCDDSCSGRRCRRGRRRRNPLPSAGRLQGNGTGRIFHLRRLPAQMMRPTRGHSSALHRSRLHQQSSTLRNQVTLFHRSHTNTIRQQQWHSKRRPTIS